MAFIYTTAIDKLRKLTKRIKVVPGGTSAGKTYGILPILIDKAATTPMLEISVVSESVPHLRKGALKDFLKIMKETGRYIDENYNRTLLTYNFTNGSYIEFFSADQEDKCAGPRRNILYINECNHVKFETYHQLAIRTDMEVWLDYNPANKFWVHEELENDEDAEFLTLTYKDNEALAASIVKEIEKAFEKAKTSSFWENWWKVYGLGQLGALQNIIFKDWSIVDKIPEDAKLLGYGMDFGFSNDPTTVVALYECDGKKYFDEIIYRKGLVNSEIAAMLKDAGITTEYIFADSADPKSIRELQNYGYNIFGAEKGPDSIRYGISLLQQEHFYITSRSVNGIKELRTYSWSLDKKNNNAEINKPIDAFNHIIDGMRYVSIEFLTNQAEFFFK